jgi:toxin ParE1/3/4
MAARFSFHPEALFEFAEASNYYLSVSPPNVAEGFALTVEAAIRSLLLDPTRCRVIEAPEIRRYLLKRFPFFIYYRWESQFERITIYAVMHCSREPGYWRKRLSERSDGAR